MDRGASIVVANGIKEDFIPLTRDAKSELKDARGTTGGSYKRNWKQRRNGEQKRDRSDEDQNKDRKRRQGKKEDQDGVRFLSTA